MKAKRICSYCQKEGKDGFMGWTDTPDGIDTHGICPEHYAEQMRIIDAMRRVKSGFYDSDIPAKKTAQMIIQEVRNDLLQRN